MATSGSDRLRLNHIGLVVENISQTAEALRRLGLHVMTNTESDPIQRVSARFVAATFEQDVHIELLEASDPQSPIANFLRTRGGGLHHLCFEVDDLDAVAQELDKAGFEMVCSPVPCVGYDRVFERSCAHPTRIAFFLVSGELLIELLQKGR
jgi:methylmalonyl-CoA/ethylmalonyl-CoA epimerase